MPDHAGQQPQSIKQDDPAVSSLHISLFGDFRLVASEKDVPTIVDMPRLQSLLAYLLLHRAAPQSRTHLAFLLWPDSTEKQAHTNLRKALYHLRQAFPHADSFLHIGRQSLAFQPSTQQAAWTLDVQDFEQAIAESEQAEHRHNLNAMHQALAQAVDLYRGDLLPGCYDEWILPERDRLRQTFFKALERLIVLLEQEHDDEGAISTALRLLRHDPLHEETYRHLMRLYAVRGDRASALRTFHTCATILERELGTAPGEATREVYEHLMQTDTASSKRVAISSAYGAAVPLVGREREWTQLLTEWRTITGGPPRVVILSGEAGIGKTRLAEELLAWVNRQGLTTASARCYEASGALAFAPVVAWLQTDAVQAHLFTLPEVWLTEVARLVPEVLVRRPDLPRPGPLTQRWQQQHLYEALARAMFSVRQPLLLLLDDLQWCDRETLEWVHYLLRFDPRAPLLLVGTVRSEEMTSGHPLTSLLMSLRRDALVTELTLDALSARDVVDLAAHLTGKEISPTIMTTLYQETEGNPLFVVETVRAGIVEKGRADHLSHGDLPARPDSFLPPTIQAVIATRLSQPSPAAREVLNLAAVIGRAFTFNVLAHASTSSEDSLVQSLDELWQRRIIREHWGDSYDFSHDKLREGAYTALSKARRRLLHHRVAEALEQIHAADLNAVSGQIAAHYEGAGLLQQAVSYYQRAGEVARQVHANAEALAAFQRALALLATFPVEISLQDRWQEVAARLHQDVGDIFALMGQDDSARDAYQKAEAQTTTSDRIRQASLHRRTAKTWESQNLYKEALAEYRLAELALDEASGSPTLEYWREWIQTRLDRLWLHHMLVQVPEMAELVEKTRPIVEQHGTQMQQASFFMDASLLHLRQNHYVVSEEVLAEAVRALAASQEGGSMNEIAWIRSHLAFCYTWRGDLDEGEKELEAVLRVGKRTGDVRLQGFCLTYLAVIFRKRGQVEKVRDYSLQALTVATATRRPQFIGIANANLAWVAWRERKLAEAAEHAQMALSLWRSMPIASPFYPFEWIAICPLLGAARAQQQFSAAIDYARALLVPEQERLPNALAALLEAAIQAWDANQPGTADAFLQQAANLGREMGYF